MTKTQRNRRPVPWAGWSKKAPKGRQRTRMLRDCGRKCFLGPKKSFPICNKGTCDVNPKGIYVSYVRARQWGNKPSSYKGKSRPTMSHSIYKRIAKTAKKMLRKYKVGRRS